MQTATMMDMTPAELLEQAMKLSEDERRQLVASLQSSLDDDEEEDGGGGGALHPAWDAELERRIAAVENGTAQGRPAAEVFADIRKQFGW